MKSLKVFKGLDIPVDYAATQKYVTLGASDSGKTFMLARFAEQCCEADIFFVILDPVGKHWSLRAGPDGNPEGGKRDVWVLGGLHGDVPLDPASGALIADTVIDHPGRYVIDVSGFETDTQVHTFAEQFAKRLFRRKAKDPGWPLLLMLEESESFLPQQPQPGQQGMKGAFGRIVRQGRNHGIGVFLVFQRSAAGDKGAISQCKVLIAKQMSHKRDRDAVDDWVEANGTREQRDEMMGALASMDVQEAYVWSPTWLKVFQRTEVLPRATFDSSANVKHGERMTSVELVPLDVDDLGAKMKAVADRAVDEDPKRLNKALEEMRTKVEQAERRLGDLDALQTHADEQAQRISQLERDLASRPTEWEVREVPVLSEAQLAPLWELADELSGAQSEIAAVRELIEKHNEAADHPLMMVAKGPDGAGQPMPAVHLQPASSPRPSKQPESGELGKAAREALEVIVAFYPTVPTPLQIGLVLGKYHTAGPFRRALTDLEEAGYTEGGRATELGRSTAPGISVGLLAAEDIQRKWLDRLSGTGRLIFQHVLNAYPSIIAYEDLGGMIGKSHNAGPIRKMFKDLVKWELAEEVSAGADGLRANPLLFDIRG